MIPIEQEELSAYLDDELSPQRREEMEALLESDPRLRAELDQLRLLDAAWAEAAAFAVSLPTANLQLSGSRFSFSVMAIAFGLIVVRMLPKVIDGMIIGVVLHTIVLAIALSWLLQTERESLLN